METKKLILGAVIIAAIAAVAVAPTIVGQAFAKRTTTTTCDIGGGTRSGSCPGNSGSNGNSNQCQTSTTKAGQGQGKGEIKGSTTSC
jgi:hypothetical protein